MDWSKIIKLLLFILLLSNLKWCLLWIRRYSETLVVYSGSGGTVVYYCTYILWNCCLLLRFCGTVVYCSGSVELLLSTQLLWNCCLLLRFCGTVVDYLHSVELVFITQVLWICCLLLKGSVELLLITYILWNCKCREMFAW